MNCSNHTNASYSCTYTVGYLLSLEAKQLTYYLLGTIVNGMVVVLTLWPKKIQGDFRWFVLNQAIQNLLYSAWGFIYLSTLVFTADNFFRTTGGSESFLQYLYLELNLDLVSKLFLSQPFALLLTSLMRFASFKKPLQYSHMSWKRILIYCLLSYLIVVPTDYRIWYLFFGASNYVQIDNILLPLRAFFYLLFPLLMSFVLNIITYRNIHKIAAQLERTRSYAELNQMRESRSFVIASLIETIVPFVTQIPYVIESFVSVYIWFAYSQQKKSVVTYAPTLYQIYSISFYYAVQLKDLQAVFAGLIILFAMAPYRRLLLSPFKKKSVSPAPADARLVHDANYLINVDF